MTISCESHGGKFTVGSMFHWYKAKRPKFTKISIRRQLSGFASLLNFAFFTKKLQNWQFSGKQRFPNFG
jgi:hypothetical protein